MVNKMDDTEIIERWNILKQLTKYHVGTIADISNEKLAYYVGGMSDRGELYYSKILGFTHTVDIEYLRDVIKKCEKQNI